MHSWRSKSGRDWSCFLPPAAVLVALLCWRASVGTGAEQEQSAGAGSRQAGSPARTAEPSPLHGEYAIGKEGRLIVLTITAAGRERLFLVDSGASLSGIDLRLSGALGPPGGRRTLQTPAGRKTVETFDWPSVQLGGQTVRSGEPIVAVDLEPLREATNIGIMGVIGMDVLRGSRVQIDFDGGHLRFLEKLPGEHEVLGAPVPLRFTADGIPSIAGHVGRDAPEYFLIDTGAQGNSLRAALFEELLAERAIRLGHSFASVTVGGEVRGDRGRLASLSIGPFVQREIRVSRLNVSSVGLRHLSRFVATFDFPGELLYLRKGAAYEKPEPAATSGMAMQWKSGQPTVISVRPGGPAAAAGIHPNDLLIRIDGRPADEYDQLSLRRLLTSEAGRRVPLAVRRAARELEAVLVLAPD